MTGTRDSISLSQFQRKDSPTGTGQERSSTTASSQVMVPDGPTSTELGLRTERRITAAWTAIERLKQKELALIAATPTPKQYRIQFSAASVAREANIGRTQIYQGHGGIRKAIGTALAEIETLLEARKKVRQPSSKRALEETIDVMKMRHEKEVKIIVSQQLSDLIRHMGPRIDEAQRDANKIKILTNKIRNLELRLAEANAAISMMTKNGI